MNYDRKFSKRSLRLLFLSLFSLQLFAFQPGINGSMHFFEALDFIGQANSRNVFIEEGNYSASAKFINNYNGKKLFIELTKASHGIYKNIEFNIPSYQSIPSTNGSFSIPSYDNGQDYDLRGSISTNESRSNNDVRTESCSRTTYRQRCEVVCRQQRAFSSLDNILDSLATSENEVLNKKGRKGKNGRIGRGRGDGRGRDGRIGRGRGDGRGRDGRIGRGRGRGRGRVCKNICRSVPVVQYGYRTITTYYRTSVKNLNFNLIDPGTDSVLATFRGSKQKSRAVFDTVRGICR